MNTRTIETATGEIGIVEHNGKEFAAGGGDVDHAAGRVAAYTSKDGALTLWSGRQIGTWRAVASWRTPRGILSDRMYQIEAVVDGILYTGRGGGEGMLWRGKRKVGKARGAYGFNPGPSEADRKALWDIGRNRARRTQMVRP
jgi:hypothetical protein